MSDGIPRHTGRLGRAKDLLWPFRRVLLPLWRPVRKYERQVERARARYRFDRRLRHLSRKLRLRWPGVRPLEKIEYDELLAGKPYYRGRWAYMSVACAVARDLIARHRLTTALELGPHLRAVLIGGDVLDVSPSVEASTEGRVIVHDATIIPWPIADRRYDLFVGLQVFEHLGDAQRGAFLEVRRIARHAIISLPIDWQMTDPADFHHEISNERALAWFEPVVPTRIVVGNPGPKKRLIYVFESLPAPPEEPAGAR